MGESVAFKLKGFGGMIPRLDDILLPQAGAAKAQNCKLLSGALVGLHQLYPREDLKKSPLYTGSGSPDIAFPIGDRADDYVWLPFDSKDTHLVKGPVTNDQYNRYYWTTPGEKPMYNTEERIRNADQGLILGVPAPVGTPTVSPEGGAPQTTRAYVYTFVSPYGEEGPPSPPNHATGGEGTWIIGNLDTTIPLLNDRAPGQWKVRIYRTLSSRDAVLWFYVGEVDLGTATFNDTVTSDDVVLNSVLQTEDWDPPPDGLDGLTLHPNGFLVGFLDNDIYMSVPYHPHAWPGEYVLATEYPIVALGIFGQSIAVLTASNPYILSGVAPLALTFTKTNSVAPCASQYGMVEFEYGVVFPSDRGLFLVNERTVENVTNDLVTGKQWELDYRPGEVQAAVRYEGQYIAFNSADTGFVFTPRSQSAAWSLLDQFTNIDSMFLNRLTGRIHVMRGGVILDWDSPNMPPVLYTWTSKVFDFPKFVNLGALRIYIDPDVEIEDIDELLAEAKAFNEERIQYPLARMGDKMFGDLHKYPLLSLVPQNRDPMAGSALRDLTRLSLNRDFIRLQVWADEKLYLDTIVQGEELVSLPSGFKAQRWQFKVSAYRRIHSIAIGSTPLALSQA